MFTTPIIHFFSFSPHLERFYIFMYSNLSVVSFFIALRFLVFLHQGSISMLACFLKHYDSSYSHLYFNLSGIDFWLHVRFCFLLPRLSALDPTGASRQLPSKPKPIRLSSQTWPINAKALNQHKALGAGSGPGCG